MTLTNARKLFNSIALFVPALCMIAFYFCDENHQVLGIATVIVFLFSSGKRLAGFPSIVDIDHVGVAYGSGYVVNFSDIAPAYSGLIFGIATSASSLNAVIGNIIAGVVIKQPTLHDWRMLFIVFFFVNLFGGIIFVILGSAVPEKWATLQALDQERNGTHSKEETVPMQPTDETKAVEDPLTDQKTRIDA